MTEKKISGFWEFGYNTIFFGRKKMKNKTLEFLLIFKGFCVGFAKVFFFLGIDLGSVLNLGNQI